MTKRHFGNGFFSVTHWSFHLFEPYPTVQAFLVEAIDNARLAHELCWLYQSTVSVNVTKIVAILIQYVIL